jgi:hypothetical protein
MNRHDVAAPNRKGKEKTPYSRPNKALPKKMVAGCRCGFLPLGPVALRHAFSRALPFSVFAVFSFVSSVRKTGGSN